MRVSNSRSGCCLLLAAVSGCGDLPFEPMDFAGVDMDGDGYPRFTPAGAILDCNDLDPSIHPDTDDPCDAVDNDCDGNIDENGDYYYLDADGDGFGRPDDIRQACEVPAGYVPDATDCADDDPRRYPGATELCDNIDNDCNGAFDDVDPDDATEVYFLDEDGDGYGDPERPIGACDDLPPTGSVDNADDCHDDDASAHLGSTAFEVAGDGVDQNCDGVDACVDLDCDGQPDVVVGWAGDELLPWAERIDGEDETRMLTLVRSSARESETGGSTLGGDVTITDVLVIDLNGDGYTDIVQAVQQPLEDPSVVYFGPFASGLPSAVDDPPEDLTLAVAQARQIAVGDFDGDGVSDLAIGAEVVNGGVTGVGIFGGVGESAGASEPVEPQVTIPTGLVNQLLVADLDSDGLDDLVICHGVSPDDRTSFDGNGLAVFLGRDLSGATWTRKFELSGGCVDVAATDLNADGYGELVVVWGYTADDDPKGSQTAVVSSDGLVTELDTPHAGSVQLVDVDADVDLDVVFGGGAVVTSPAGPLVFDSTVHVHLNDGGTVSTAPDLALESEGGLRPVFGDVNGDGRIDLVAPGMFEDTADGPETYIYLGADASSPDPFQSDSVLKDLGSWVYGTTTDFDGDGLTDILAVGSGQTGGLRLMKNVEGGTLEQGDLIVEGPSSLQAPIVVP